MGDLLVRLYDLPQTQDITAKMEEQNISIRRPMSFESRMVVKWVEDSYGQSWAMQAQASFYNNPISCFIAVKDNRILGFAAYDATCRNFFGPTGVDKYFQGIGIGKALLLAALNAIKSDGYAYAIIGGAGPVDYYTKILDAQMIEKSSPGVYKDRLPI